MQYVERLLGERPSNGAEEGYGTMIVEMGIVAPFFWIFWTAALLYYCWKVMRQLRKHVCSPSVWQYFAIVSFSYTGSPSLG